MIRKNITLLFLIFILTNCGFSPIYQNNIDLDFSIQNISYKGDRELNNFLKTNLNQYKNEKNINKIDIEVNSIYEKSIFSKNRTGDITNYQLKAEVTFLIKPLKRQTPHGEPIASFFFIKMWTVKFHEYCSKNSALFSFAHWL